jgi:DNA-binding transcriptional ArsR family regulator
MMIFEALADPTRRRILDLLRERPRLVGELVDAFKEQKLSQPGISKHLRVLREAGLVNVRQDAQRRWYEIRMEPLMALDSWLDAYRHLWNDRMDRLEAVIMEIQRQENLTNNQADADENEG